MDSIPEVPGASKAHLDVGRGRTAEVARGVSSARDLFYFIFYPLWLFWKTRGQITETPLTRMRTCSECTACRRTRHQDRPRSRFPCHLRWHTRSYAPPTQRRRRWIERSVATRRVGPARWIERSAATHWHAPGARVGPAGGSLVVVHEEEEFQVGV